MKLSEIREMAEAEEQALIYLKRYFREVFSQLPQNPEAKQIAKNCISIPASAVITWSPYDNDFLAQYAVIFDQIDKCKTLSKIVIFLDKIINLEQHDIKEVRLRVKNYTVIVHPRVIELLRAEFT